MKTRPSRALGIAALALATITASALLLPVLGMILLGLATLLLPLAAVIVPALLFTLVWILLAPAGDTRSPAVAAELGGPRAGGEARRGGGFAVGQSTSL